MNNKMTIGIIAKKANTTIRTIQYYNEIGLLYSSEYTEGGNRLYNEDDLNKLLRILFLKEIGLSLNEIKLNYNKYNNPVLFKKIIENHQKQLNKKSIEIVSTINLLDEFKDNLESNISIEPSFFTELISSFKIVNDYNWVFENIDINFSSEITDMFNNSPKDIELFFDKWKQLNNKILELKNKSLLPESEETQIVIEKYWNLVMSITKGDPTILSNLIEFEKTHDSWDSGIKETQELISDYISQSLSIYFENNNIEFNIINQGD